MLPLPCARLRCLPHSPPCLSFRRAARSSNPLLRPPVHHGLHQVRSACNSRRSACPPSAQKAWVLPVYTVWRVIIWGLIGVAITFMMKTYSFGVAGLVESGYLPGAKAEFWNKLLCAFYTAAVMNLTFGPTFMAFHKCTDRYLELRAEGKKARTPPSHRNGGLAQIRFLHAVQNDSAVLDSRTHSDLHAPSGVSGHCRRNSFHRSRNHFEPQILTD